MTHPNGPTTQYGTRGIWNRGEDTHCGNCGLIQSRPLDKNLLPYEVKESDILRAVTAVTSLPSPTLPDSPFIRVLGTSTAHMAPPQTGLGTKIPRGMGTHSVRKQSSSDSCRYASGPTRASRLFAWHSHQQSIVGTIWKPIGWVSPCRLCFLVRGHGLGSVDRQCSNSEVNSGVITGSAPPVVGCLQVRLLCPCSFVCGCGQPDALRV